MGRPSVTASSRTDTPWDGLEFNDIPRTPMTSPRGSRRLSPNTSGLDINGICSKIRSISYSNSITSSTSSQAMTASPSATSTTAHRISNALDRAGLYHRTMNEMEEENMTLCSEDTFDAMSDILHDVKCELNNIMMEYD